MILESTIRIERPASEIAAFAEGLSSVMGRIASFENTHPPILKSEDREILEEVWSFLRKLSGG